MKNKINEVLILFTTLICLLIPGKLKASHLYGYDAQWKKIGTNTYELKVTQYLDCASGSSCQSNSIKVTDDSSYTNFSSNNYSPTSTSYTIITPICSGFTSLCNSTSPQFPLGISKCVSFYTINLSGAATNCCWFKIEIRPITGYATISTMNSGFYSSIASVLLNRCVGNDNSPVFGYDPLLIKMAGHDIIYNNGLFDLDGDSISYETAYPNNEGYAGVWNKDYPLNCFGYNISNNPNTSPIIGYNVDLNDGSVRVTPTTILNTVTKMKIIEWRKINNSYKIIGITFRECILNIITTNGNKSPTITTPRSFEVCAGQQLCFYINTADVNTSDSTTLISNSLSRIPNSTFTNTTAPLQNKASAQFCWTPDTGKIRTMPYYFNVEVRDNKCPVFGSNIYTYSIKVIKTPTLTTEIKRKSCTYYDAIAKVSSTVLNSNSRWEIYFSGQLKKYYTDKDSIRLMLDTTGTYILKYLFTNSGCLLTKYDTINYIAPPVFQITSSKDTTVCENSTLLLSTTPLGGEAPFKYEWRLDSIIIDTTQTISISVKDSAQYIVKVISGDSCNLFTYDTVNVIADTSHLVVTQLIDTTICKGEYFQLVPIITIGKSPFNYFWYKNNSLVSTNPIFTDNPNTSSTYILRIVSSDNCYNTVYDTIVINVDTSHLQVTPLNDTILCNGATLNLTPTILKGKSPFNYFWFKNNILISTNNTLTENPSSATTYSLKIISSDPCNNTFYDTVNASFFPNTLQLKLPNDTTICANTPYTLKAQVSGASSYNYNWCPQGKTCSALPNPVYSFDTSTQIILDVSSNDNCFETKRDTIMVYVFPLKQLLISATSTSINKGQTTVIKISNGNNFSWSGNNIITNWGDSILVKPTLNSTYRAIGINNNGCADTSEITIQVTYVGIDKSLNHKNNLLIYPNPAKDELVVSGKFSSQNTIQFSITNSLSQVLIEGILKEDETIIDIHILAPGIYFIHAGNERFEFVKR